MAISPTNDLVFHSAVIGGMNAQRFHDFLAQTRLHLDPDEHVILIYDGAPAHNNPAILRPNTELKKLPPYILEHCGTSNKFLESSHESSKVLQSGDTVSCHSQVSQSCVSVRCHSDVLYVRCHNQVFQSGDTVRCHSRISQSGDTVICHSQAPQSGLTVRCHSQGSQSGVTVRCPRQVSQSGVIVRSDS